jgi:hypothetical protein
MRGILWQKQGPSGATLATDLVGRSNPGATVGRGHTRRPAQLTILALDAIPISGADRPLPVSPDGLPKRRAENLLIGWARSD